MPKIEQTETVEIDVAPEVLARVAAIVSTIQETQDDIDLLTAQIADEKKKIMDIYVSNGIKSLRIDDVPVTLVSGGTSSTLDKKKFVLLGGDLEDAGGREGDEAEARLHAHRRRERSSTSPTRLVDARSRP